MTLLAIACLFCALLPAAIFCLNLRAYRPPPHEHLPPPRISILIPARNEESGIADAVHAALASTAVSLEVIVMDDNSTDRTAAIVRELATTYPNLRLEQAPPLPAGWNGKQHACWHLAHAATGELLCFVDADVRLAPEAASRMAAFLVRTHSQLVSGFPRQITLTWLEQLLLPLIHFILLGYLPIPQMRRNPSPAYAAGCGQFLLVDRAAYFASGGHAAIRATMHDGIKLPRLLRTHGFRTDLADLTPLASVRMYTSAPQVWNGLAKNAAEGMAAPATILPATLFLALGEVIPFVLVLRAVIQMAASLLGHALILSSLRITDLLSIAGPAPRVTLLALSACCLAILPRLLAVLRFRQPVLSALLHPLGILLLLALQWYSLLRKLTGAQITWKSRAYTGQPLRPGGAVKPQNHPSSSN